MIKCGACKKPIETDNSDVESVHCVQILRGWFTIPKEHGDIVCNNEKANLFICLDCYLKDPDLCAFFNKIGWRIR